MDGNRFIYKLVLKRNKTDNVTYESLRKGLVLLLKHMNENEVKNIVLPLDEQCCIRELSWNAVRTLIKNVFHESSISMVVYNNSLSSVNSVESIDERISSTKDVPTPFLDIFQRKSLKPIDTSYKRSLVCS